MCLWILLSSDTAILYHRADSKLAPSQRETLLQSNAISHWFGAYLESVLSQYILTYSMIYWQQIPQKDPYHQETTPQYTYPKSVYHPVAACQ